MSLKILFTAFNLLIAVIAFIFLFVIGDKLTQGIFLGLIIYLFLMILISPQGRLRIQ